MPVTFLFLICVITQLGYTAIVVILRRHPAVWVGEQALEDLDLDEGDVCQDVGGGGEKVGEHVENTVSNVIINPRVCCTLLMSCFQFPALPWVWWLLLVAMMSSARDLLTAGLEGVEEGDGVLQQVSSPLS